MKLVEYMPPYLKNVLEFNIISNIEDVELKKIQDRIEEILKEVVVATAETYGLDKYEKIYNIEKTTNDLLIRRYNVLAKINNRAPYTINWLKNKLNNTIGEENYTLTTKGYELNIKINLVYTEAAEMLKSNLIKQIPANIKLDYELETKLNEFIGAAISRQDYIVLNAVAFERKENVTLNQNNNMGLSVINKEYVDLKPNTDSKIENNTLDLNTETALKVSRQDYMDLSVATDEKQENITLNQNNNVGLNVINQDYIVIEEVK